MLDYKCSCFHFSFRYLVVAAGQSLLLWRRGWTLANVVTGPDITFHRAHAGPAPFIVRIRDINMTQQRGVSLCY